jgi:hypothetical protein
MSVNTNTQTGTDLNNNADDSPLIGSAFGDYTPKQRRVLVAADAMAAERPTTHVKKGLTARWSMTTGT